MRRHKLGFRIDRATDFEHWWVVRYPDEEFVEDLDEDDLEVLGTMMILYTPTVKVTFFAHRSNDELQDLEPVIHDICRDLRVKDAEVKVVRSNPLGYSFSLSDPVGVTDAQVEISKTEKDGHQFDLQDAKTGQKTIYEREEEDEEDEFDDDDGEIVHDSIFQIETKKGPMVLRARIRTPFP